MNVSLRPPKCTIRRIEQRDKGYLWMLPFHDRADFDRRMSEQREGTLEVIGAFLRRRGVGQVILDLRGKEGVAHLTGSRLCADIGNLFVVFALRRLGIGTSLLHYAERQCIARGFEFVGLGVNVKDAGPQRLYHRLGYKDTDLIEHCRFDIPMEGGKSQTVEEDCVYLLKRLGREEAPAREGRVKG